MNTEGFEQYGRTGYGILLYWALIFCLFFSCTVLLTAEEKSFNPAHMEFEKIRTPGTSYSLMEDRKGFLWIGTDIGLWRYDGYGFEDYTHIVPERIDSQIFQDQEGSIWIGTHSRLVEYNPETRMCFTYRYDSADPVSISSHIFQWKKYAFCEDRHGRLWIAANNGLNLFDKTKKTFSVYTSNSGGLMDDCVNAIIPSRDGLLWVATTTGLQKFDPDSRRVIVRYPGAPSNMHSLCEGPEGDLWIGSSTDFVYSLDPATGTFKSFHSDQSSLGSNRINYINIFPDIPDVLWIATSESGLNLLNTGSGEVIPFSGNSIENQKINISETQQTQIIQDKMGAIYILSSQGFLYRFDPENYRFTILPFDQAGMNTLSVDSSFSACLDHNGSVWIYIGTTGQLYRYSPDSHSFADVYNLPGYIETSNESTIIDDNAGNLWITAKDKIIQFDILSKKVTALIPVTGSLWNGIQDKTDPSILWYGSPDRGLVKVNTITRKVTNYLPKAHDPLSIGSRQVLVLAQNDDGTIWLSAFGVGLQCFDPRREYVIDRHTLGINIGDPVGIFRDSHGRHWVSFQNGGPGLFYPETRKFWEFDALTGTDWPAHGSTGILEDKNGTLWVSSNAGGEIVQFDPKNNSVKLYTRADGIADGTSLPWQNRPLIDSEDAMWFSGIGGVTRFLPEQVKDNPYLPPVYITELSQDGIPIETKKAFEATEEIILPHDKNYFEFEASALNFRFPAMNRYQYKLIGWDEHWRNIGAKRTGQYSNLTEGMYILEVRGSNNDGVWNPQPARLSIYVEPRIPENARLFSLTDIQKGEKAGLKYYQNTIMFEAAPLDYTILEKEHYEYKLEGYDTEWIAVTSSRYILYTKIPDGRFTFKIRNTESGENYSLPVSIQPPFYQSWWFLFLCAMMITGVVGLFYKQRIEHLKREQEEVIHHQQEELRHVDSERRLEREKRKAVEAQRESEERYRELLTTMTEGFLIVDRKGTLQYANNRFCELLQLKQDELRKINLSQFMDKANSRIFNKNLFEQETDDLPAFEMQWQDRSGQKIDTLVSPKPIADSSRIFTEFFAVITNITELKKTELMLRKREKELNIEKNHLEEANITLNVLLKHRDQEIYEVEQSLNLTLQRQVVPYVEKIKNAGLEDGLALYLNIISSNLANITSGYSRKLGTLYADLTGKEIQITDMIREGLSTKEIASFLNISVRTVEIHRTNIRKKLGLTGIKDNLQTYLLSSTRFNN